MKRSLFWACETIAVSANIFTVVSWIIEAVSIVLNVFTLCLLFMIGGKTRTSLIMLRTLITCCIFIAFFSFLESLYPVLRSLGNYYLDQLLCSVLFSKFLRQAFLFIGAHAHIYFVINRTIQIVSRLQFSFATSKNIDLIYVALFVVFGILLTFPQCFTVTLQNGNCRCFDIDTEVLRVELVYAEAFIVFFEICLFNSILLCISSIRVLKWRATTPLTSRIDTLNLLCFAGTTEAELALFDATRGWNSASNCMIPLTVLYTLAISLDCSYQFLAAVGLVVYNIGGPVERAGQLLTMLYPLGVPLIILFYVPALRLHVTRGLTISVESIRRHFHKREINTPTAFQSESIERKEIDNF